MWQVMRRTDRCLCWLEKGQHELIRSPRTGRFVCRHCGKDATDAQRASNDFQQSWTEYHEEDFLREVSAQGTVAGAVRSALLVPRRWKEAHFG